MKLKFSIIVALCAFMGFVACGKGKKNSSAKIRNANQAAANKDLNDKNDKSQQTATPASSSRAQAPAKSTRSSGTTAQPKAQASIPDYSQEELFTADIQVTAFDKENNGINQELKASQVKPEVDVSECKVVTTDDSHRIEITLSGISEDEDEITTVLKFSFNAVINDGSKQEADVEVTSLKIQNIKDDKVNILSEIEKVSNDENALSYTLVQIPADKIKKHSESTLRLVAAIQANSLKDKNEKDVTVYGTIECAVDFAK